MTRGRIFALVGGGVVVAGIAAALIAWWLLSQPPSARDAAARYLEALAASDVTSIERMLPDELSADERDVLTAAYAGASETIAEPRVEEVGEQRAGRVAVRASADLGGERRSFEVPLVREDDGWVLGGEALAAVTAGTTRGDAVRLGDALVVAGEPVAVLPARYPVSPAPAQVLSGGAETVALPGDESEITIEPDVTDQAQPLAQSGLEDYLEDCAGGAASVPEGCGIRIPWGAELATADDFAYRIDRMPQLELAAEDSSFLATGGDYVVTVTGTDREGAPASVTYRDDDWTVRGALLFAGDEMVLQVW
ncbi:DUF2950 domain-containing protein [Microbacterium sp. LRZ72]|uniref:hypothetical protein n=1 Tax=Microbacterium sp. LRZ72 TaxID=2942481 RepID=UPI0029A42499|nr:hypothetical protein [Microbacterium sp. LRZ72]MDX2375815.1 DUF2950 domain-containing protein [Microbacterium sp. LRZ72]